MVVITSVFPARPVPVNVTLKLSIKDEYWGMPTTIAEWIVSKLGLTDDGSVTKAEAALKALITHWQP
jgi:hypothetical protein